MGFEWLALVAAFLWAMSSLLSVIPAQHLGTFAYSRWRMGCTSIILGVIALTTGGWSSIHTSALLAMMLSGLIGIFIGDTALFACLNRMGPRQSGLLFSCHALFSAILGYFLFAERMTNIEFVGALLVFSGVLIAIFFGRQGQKNNRLETIKGKISIGIGLGLLAALCQALGGIIAKPIMQSAIDPIAASAVRMATAFTAHCLLYCSGIKLARTTQPINLKIFIITAINGFLAMAVGMTLILYALQEGQVGMVALLSSTTPIMLLPILWLYSGKRPNKFAWLGAVIAVIGSALLVS